MKKPVPVYENGLYELFTQFNENVKQTKCGQKYLLDLFDQIILVFGKVNFNRE